MTQSRIIRALTIAALVAAVAPSGFAQTPEGDKAARIQAEIDAIAANKEAYVADLVSEWKRFSNDDGAELRMFMTAASPSRLRMVQKAKSVDEVNRLLGSAPQQIGENTVDLVFTPVAPCRLVNTIVAGGQLGAGSTRSFTVNGTLTGQGGDGAGCGMPGENLFLGEPVAAMLTVVAVQPTGAGNLRAFPAGGAVPNSSIINYLDLTGVTGNGNDNIANTTVVSLTSNAFNANEFTIQCDVSATHVVIDVAGYFWKPRGSLHAIVQNDGTLDTTRSRGFLTASRPAVGVHCLTPIDTTVSAATTPSVASVDWGASVSGQNGLAHVVRTATLGCAAGDFEVRTFLAQTGAATNNLAFHLVVP
jgi:hypothetical protein